MIENPFCFGLLVAPTVIVEIHSSYIQFPVATNLIEQWIFRNRKDKMGAGAGAVLSLGKTVTTASDIADGVTENIPEIPITPEMSTDQALQEVQQKILINALGLEPSEAVRKTRNIFPWYFTAVLFTLGISIIHWIDIAVFKSNETSIIWWHSLDWKELWTPTG